MKPDDRPQGDWSLLIETTLRRSWPWITHSQLRMLLAMLSGSTRDADLAAELGWKKETIRKYVSKMIRATASRSRAGLVAKAWATVADEVLTLAAQRTPLNELGGLLLDEHDAWRAPPHYDGTPQESRPDPCCEELLAVGEALNWAGEEGRAKALFARAAEIANALGRPEQLARAALGFGGSGILAGVTNDGRTDLIEQALEALGDCQSSLQARLMARLSVALYYEPGSFERRDCLSREALEIAEQVGDASALAYAVAARHFAVWRPDNVNERIEAANEILRLAAATNDQDLKLRGYHWRRVDSLELGDIQATRADIEARDKIARAMRWSSWHWVELADRAWQALMSGDLAEAEQLAHQALHKARRGQAGSAVPVFWVQTFVLRREQGRLQEIEAPVKGLVHSHPEIPAWRAALAVLHSELGRDAEARQEFELLAAHEFDDLPRDANWLIGTAFLAEVCHFLGDQGRAARLYDFLLPYARRNVVIGWAAASYGCASRQLGLLATTLGRWTAAEKHFEDALLRDERMGAQPAVARTRYDYAQMLMAQAKPRHRGRALHLATEALDIASKLGLTSLAQKAGVLLECAKSD